MIVKRDGERIGAGGKGDSENRVILNITIINHRLNLKILIVQ